MIEIAKDRSDLDELARRSVVYADQMPAAGFRQPSRILEDYPARSTALLRLTRGVAVPVDATRSGLELLVVEGEVTVNGVPLGQYGYIRRPRSPAPLVTAIANTLVFIKRGHIPLEDAKETIVSPHPALWQAEPGSGVRTLPLHRHALIEVALRQYPPGSAPEPRRPPGGEEILVLAGTLLDERSAYPRGSWIRNPPGSLYQPYSVEGCLVYAQAGHLPII